MYNVGTHYNDTLFTCTFLYSYDIPNYMFIHVHFRFCFLVTFSTTHLVILVKHTVCVLHVVSTFK